MTPAGRLSVSQGTPVELLDGNRRQVDALQAANVDGGDAIALGSTPSPYGWMPGKVGRTPRTDPATIALVTIEKGVYSSYPLQSLIEFLRRTPGLAVAQEGDRLVIRSR